EPEFGGGGEGARAGPGKRCSPALRRLPGAALPDGGRSPSVCPPTEGRRGSRRPGGSAPGPRLAGSFLSESLQQGVAQGNTLPAAPAPPPPSASSQTCRPFPPPAGSGPGSSSSREAGNNSGAAAGGGAVPRTGPSLLMKGTFHVPCTRGNLSLGTQIYTQVRPCPLVQIPEDAIRPPPQHHRRENQSPRGTGVGSNRSPQDYTEESHSTAA
ncbi:hypothetical protein Nmel_002360, partial [Mimus melanotis]